MRVIPEIIDVSRNTFNNYRNLKLEQSQDIPHRIVRQLEVIFDLKTDQLANFDTRGKTWREHYKEICPGDKSL